MATKKDVAKKVADSKEATAAPKKVAAKKVTIVASTDSVYVNEHLTTSDAIEAAIKANPDAKVLKHWGGLLDVKHYKNGSNSPD